MTKPPLRTISCQLDPDRDPWRYDSVRFENCLAEVRSAYAGTRYESDVKAICSVLALPEVQLRGIDGTPHLCERLVAVKTVLSCFPESTGRTVFSAVHKEVLRFESCRQQCKCSAGGCMLVDPKWWHPLYGMCRGTQCENLSVFKMIDCLPEYLRAIDAAGFANDPISVSLLVFLMKSELKYGVQEAKHLGESLSKECCGQKRDISSLAHGGSGSAVFLSVLRSGSCTSLEEVIDVATVSLPSNYLSSCRLGKGAVATVYLARNNIYDNEDSDADSDEALVALKVVSKTVLDVNSKVATNSLARLRRLNIPYVAKYFEFIEHGDNAILSMEPFKMTLADCIADFSRGIRVDGSPISEPTGVMNLFEQMLIGLAKCHEGGVIHCDLAPNNVGISELDEVRLTDFNPSVYFNMEQKQGPLDYLSRRQLLNPEDKSVTAHDTGWSLGVILYEMLTGKKLFSHPPMPDRFEDRDAYKRVMLGRILQAEEKADFFEGVANEIAAQRVSDVWCRSFLAVIENGLYERGFYPAERGGADDVLSTRRAVELAWPRAMSMVIKTALFGCEKSPARSEFQSMLREAGAYRKIDYILMGFEGSARMNEQARLSITVRQALGSLMEYGNVGDEVSTKLPLHCLLVTYHDELRKICMK